MEILIMKHLFGMFDLSLKDIAKDLATYKLQDANENILFQKLGTGTGNLKPYLASTNSLSSHFKGLCYWKNEWKLYQVYFSIVSRVKLCGLKLKYKFRRENFQKLTVLYQAKLLVTSCVTSCRNFVLSTPHNKVGRKQITWPWNFAVDDNMQCYCFDNRLSSACLTFILSEKKTIRMNWDGKNYYRKSINKKVALLSTTNNDQAVVWN